MTDRLHAADPLAALDTSADARALYARVLSAARADAAPLRRGPSTALRITVATGVAAVATAVALAFLPGDDTRAPSRASLLPGPVAAFADEVRHASVLHVISTDTGTLDARGTFTAVKNPERAESWYATDGSASRTRYLGPDGTLLAESVRKGDEVWNFNARDGLVQRYTTTMRPRSFLLNLRKGVDADRVRLVGRSVVRGQDAYEVAFDQYPGDAYPEDSRAFLAVDGGALLRVDALNLPLPADPKPDYPRTWRTEVDAFGSEPADADTLEPSPQFRGELNDTPAQPGPGAP